MRALWQSTERVASRDRVAAAVAAAGELAPFGAQDDDAAMPHSLIADPVGEVAIQSGAVVSKVVHRGDGMNVTVFGFGSGEELHRASGSPRRRGSGPVRAASLHR